MPQEHSAVLQVGAFQRLAQRGEEMRLDGSGCHEFPIGGFEDSVSGQSPGQGGFAPRRRGFAGEYVLQGQEGGGQDTLGHGNIQPLPPAGS